MKRLFLLRHAKAGFGLSDAERPLAARGRRDALWLGRHLAGADLLPEHIFCSAAARARESLDHLRQGMASANMESAPMKRAPSSSLHDDLYLASARRMTALIRKADDRLASLMIIAHNPGLARLFRDLLNRPPAEGRSLKYPTCALGVIDFDVARWNAVESNTGQLYYWLVPSDAQAKK